MRALLAALLATLVGACDYLEPEGRDRPPDAAPNANFFLYVSNQSFARPTVDIRVEIDGRPVVADEFAVENQHNWVECPLRLGDGAHVLHAESTEGGAAVIRTFRARGKRWAVLDYWCCDDPSEPKFTFYVARRPIAFA